MKIRFVKPWMAYRPNQEIDTPFPGVVDLLIRRGLAIEIKPAPAASADQPKGGKPRTR